MILVSRHFFTNEIRDEKLNINIFNILSVIPSIKSNGNFLLGQKFSENPFKYY